LPTHRLTWVDVFCDAPLEGNPLAVVHDADDLDDDAMLRFARETGLSETTFVQAATAPGADYRNRIFDPAREIPFAGHPSLGTAVAVARARGETTAAYVQQTGAGLQPVEVDLEGERARASMLQEPAEFGPELDPADVLPRVGLRERDADRALPVQVVSTGVPQVLAPVGDLAALDRLDPDPEAIAQLCDRFDAITLYVAHCDPAEGVATARAFGHAPQMGEDPATGSAAGPLTAYLARRTGATELEISQGTHVGRPSRLSCRLEGDRVRVAGGVSIVIDGTVRL
jgi:trans-2,3-dihydro-3-hydroxyanthranilate isomerase